MKKGYSGISTPISETDWPIILDTRGMKEKGMDQLDVRILDLLQVDGRRPFVQIAKELGVSDATVRARVERLTKRGTVKFVVDVDPNELGLTYVYIGVRVQGPAMNRVVERMASLPEVIFLVRITGGYDLLAELVCRDNDDLMHLMDEMRAIPGVVSLDVFTVLKVEKEEWRYNGLTAG